MVDGPEPEEHGHERRVRLRDAKSGDKTGEARVPAIPVGFCGPARRYNRREGRTEKEVGSYNVGVPR